MWFISSIIVFSFIYVINYILKLKLKQLVILYVSIWNTPYPTNKVIDKITNYILIVAYILLLVYFIAFNK